MIEWLLVSVCIAQGAPPSPATFDVGRFTVSWTGTGIEAVDTASQQAVLSTAATGNWLAVSPAELKVKEVEGMLKINPGSESCRTVSQTVTSVVRGSPNEVLLTGKVTSPSKCKASAFAYTVKIGLAPG